MIKESFASRELHHTKDGTTLTQFFSVKSQDVFLWYDATQRLPIIGDFWAQMPTLICSDIWVRWQSQDIAVIEALYSTKGLGVSSEIPDKVSSMRYHFNIINTQEEIKSYLNIGNSTQYEWSAVWATAKGMDVELAPPLYKNNAGMTMTIDVYLSKWNLLTVKDNIGKINDRDFLKQMIIANPHKSKITEIDVSGDDTGQWLFSGCTAETVAKGNTKLSYLFLGSAGGWDTTDGVETDHIESFNFLDLPWPNDTNDEFKIGEIS